MNTTKTHTNTFKKAATLAAAIAALAVVSIGCGGGGGGSTASTSPDNISVAALETGVITGTLEDTTAAARGVAGRASAKAPLAGARVYACEEGSELKVDRSKRNATTDKDGKFTITNVPRGKYSLVIDRDDDGITDDTVSNVSVEKDKESNVGPVPVAAPAPKTSPDNSASPSAKDDSNHENTTSPGDNSGNVENHDSTSNNSNDSSGAQKSDDSYCTLKLDKVLYSTGETLVMTVTGYNPGPSPVKCGVKISLRKWRNHPEQWRTNFNNSSEYIVLPAGSTGTGTVSKVIPASWALTNSKGGSDYRASTIHENGETWGKGDNFNILKKHAACKSTKSDDDKNNNAKHDEVKSNNGNHGDKNDDSCDTTDDDTDNDNTGGTTGGDTTGGTTDTGGTTGGTTDTGGTTGGDTGGTVTPPPTAPPPSCTVACTTDAQCDDAIPFTIDSCSNPGTCDAMCLNTDF